jgi:hypothetical protein
MFGSKPSVMLVIRGLGSSLTRQEFEKRYKKRIPLFLEVPGLIQKYFSYDQSTAEWAGIYLWETQEALDNYLTSDLLESIKSAYDLPGLPRLECYPIVGILKD